MYSIAREYARAPYDGRNNKSFDFGEVEKAAKGAEKNRHRAEVETVDRERHGRDSRLRVWSLDGIDDPDAGFSGKPPVDAQTLNLKQPWLLHALEISTLDFCSFANCGIPPRDVADTAVDGVRLLVAVPGHKDSDVEIYELPSEKQVALIPAPAQTSGRAGMVMALALLRKSHGRDVHVVCGYENGRACIFKQQASTWELIYSAQPHSQPILSLDVAPSLDAFFTSGADAMVVKHPLFAANATMKEVQTKHSGQQGLRVRDDARILATAGWDSKMRVYSSKTLKELAVLKWHKEGCYALDFALVESQATDSSLDDTTSLQTPSMAREKKARNTHWLAAGSKDGKVSLWDIY
ncbi:MAG: hypothetical protein Q9159_006617 [Coniocarpon cinnabarinum]